MEKVLNNLKRKVLSIVYTAVPQFKAWYRNTGVRSSFWELFQDRCVRKFELQKPKCYVASSLIHRFYDMISKVVHIYIQVCSCFSLQTIMINWIGNAVLWSFNRRYLGLNWKLFNTHTKWLTRYSNIGDMELNEICHSFMITLNSRCTLI